MQVLEVEHEDEPNSTYFEEDEVDSLEMYNDQRDDVDHTEPFEFEPDQVDSTLDDDLKAMQTV